MSELMDKLALLETQAAQLYAQAAALKEEREDLVDALSECLKARLERLRGRLDAAKSPAVHLGFSGLTRSDGEFAAALKAIIDSSEQLKQTWQRWEPAAKSAMLNVEAAIDDARREGELRLEVADAVEDATVTARLGKVLCDFTIGAALTIDHQLLLAAYDANARYLGRKEWVRSKALEAVRTSMESVGEDAVAWAIGVGAVTIGVAAPSAMAVAGVILTTKLIYGMTKSQSSEAAKRLDAAVAEFDKMYELERLNLQLAANAQRIARTYVDTNAAAVEALQGLEKSVHRVVSARFDLDSLIAEVEEVRLLKEIMARRKS